MGTANAVWGIDVGQCALKAIKLRPAGDGQVEALAFDVVEHPKILSQPDADRDELIRESVKKFAERNDTRGDKFVVGVPGQQTFARFCKMPPIDLKKDARRIHDLVKYEASQQIPFDIDDVVWDYQVFAAEGSPDIEVGIFAIRKDLIRKHLSFFTDAGIAPSAVQAIPAALYNFAKFDLPVDPKGASVLVDVGAQNTDLIIVEPNSAWTRNIPLGGNSFTETLVRSFKLSFSKAETLKREAADSKYARQIFQAMRPIFAELVAEIQRSIGFYGSTHRGVELSRLYALGNAFHLPGLQKYLENNLQLAGGVAKLERFHKIIPSPAIENPTFVNNVLTFSAAYGLALQGLKLARINASLLPTELARLASWQKKRPFFVATAACFALASVVPFAADALDMQQLGSQSAQSAQARMQEVIRKAKDFKDRFQKATGNTTQSEASINKLLGLQHDRQLIARLVTLVHDSLPPVNPEELNTALHSPGVTAAEIKKLIETDPKRFPRLQRYQFYIDALSIDYRTDVDSENLNERSTPGGGGPPTPPAPGQTPGKPGGAPGAAPGGAGKDGFIVRVQGRLLGGERPADVQRWLDDELFQRLREQGGKPGNGFFIPPLDPNDRAGGAIGKPKFEKFVPDRSSNPTPTPDPHKPPNLPNQPTPPGGAPAVKTEDAAMDPVTGEDMRDDWTVSFAFKVRRGEPPPPPAAAGDKGQPPKQPQQGGKKP